MRISTNDPQYEPLDDSGIVKSSAKKDEQHNNCVVDARTELAVLRKEITEMEKEITAYGSLGDSQM